MEPESVTKRTAVACEECRRRKSKCDGVRPVCSPCQTVQKACHFVADVETRKRKKYSDDYVASLEEQIVEWKAYAAELKASQPWLRQPHGLGYSPRDLQADIKTPRINHSPSGETYETLQETLDQRSQAAVEEVGTIIWRMHVGDSGEPSFTGPSGNFYMSDSVVSPPGNQNHRRQSVPSALADNSRLFSEFVQDLELKQHLIERFMTCVNPLHLFVQLDVSLSPAAYPHQDLGLRLLHTAIFASGARYSDGNNISATGDLLMKYAETSALSCCRTHPSVTVVQALGVLCWRELTCQHDNMAWIYNSVGGGLATSLGLHAMGLKNLAGPTIAKSSDEQCSRIRTFWSFFLMDRVITTLLGRNCTIPWQRITTSSFGSILAADAALEEIAFDHECRLWFLHDQYMDQIYSFSPSELDSSHRDRLLLESRQGLLSFYSNIDSRLQFKKSNMPISAIFLQMSYQMSITLIHRPYLRESVNPSIKKLALSSMTISATATTRLILMFRKLDTLNNAPPFIIHHILTAAIVHLLNTTDSRMELRTPASNKLKVCLDALEAMRVTWPRAAKAILLLQELANRWCVVSSLPIRFSNLSDNNPPLRQSQPTEPLPKAATTTVILEENRDNGWNGTAFWDLPDTTRNAVIWQDESYPFTFDGVYLGQFDSSSIAPEQFVDYNFAENVLDDLHAATDYAVFSGVNANGLFLSHLEEGMEVYGEK